MVNEPDYLHVVIERRANGYTITHLATHTNGQKVFVFHDWTMVVSHLVSNHAKQLEATRERRRDDADRRAALEAEARRIRDVCNIRPHDYPPPKPATGPNKIVVAGAKPTFWQRLTRGRWVR